MLQKYPLLPDAQIAFGMMVYHEAPALVDVCLSHLRAAYPKSPVVVILDGKELTPELNRAIRGRAFVLATECLKRGLENGAALWTRLFDALLPFKTDYLVKLDPDTRVHRPLRYYPVPGTLTSVGTLMSAGYEAQHVQGGFQLFTREFARVAREESLSSIYRDHDGWACGQSNLFADRGIISSDYTLRAMTLNTGMTMISHPELDCRSLQGQPERPEAKPWMEDAAVTHPHKIP